MSIVKSCSKQNNTAYLHEQDYKWNPETKRPEGTRKLIGKLDPVTGEMIPTGKRGRPKKVSSDSGKSVSQPIINPYEDEMKKLLKRNKELSEEITALKKALHDSEKKVNSVIKMVHGWVE